MYWLMPPLGVNPVKLSVKVVTPSVPVVGEIESCGFTATAGRDVPNKVSRTRRAMWRKAEEKRGPLIEKDFIPPP